MIIIFIKLIMTYFKLVTLICLFNFANAFLSRTVMFNNKWYLNANKNTNNKSVLIKSIKILDSYILLNSKKDKKWVPPPPGYIPYRFKNVTCELPVGYDPNNKKKWEPPVGYIPERLKVINDINKDIENIENKDSLYSNYVENYTNNYNNNYNTIKNLEKNVNVLKKIVNVISDDTDKLIKYNNNYYHGEIL